MPPTRRALLRASALGLGGSIAGCAGASDAGASDNRQETTTEATDETTTPTREPDETILLGGEVGHWFGLAPEAIHGEENMALGLQPGTVYEILWVNIDGIRHELRIFDDDDNEVAASETVSSVGETASVVFEATESLAYYDCEYHQQNMRGEIMQGAMTTTTTETGDGDGGDDGDGDGGPGY